MILSAGIFLLISIGIGYGALLLARPRPVLDCLVLSLPVGAGMLPIVILLMRAAHIPLDIGWLACFAAIGPVISVVTGRMPRGTTSKSRLATHAIVVTAAVLVTGMLHFGATRYPYLEDDDPWGHAAGAHYVALEKTACGADEATGRYLEPYPPYFTALMGMLHQTNPDLQGVLKFFNAVLIGISLLAAFHAFEAIGRNMALAAAGAIILGMLPAYMSHFIWSQTLAIPVFLIAVWAVATLEQEPGTGAWHRKQGFVLAAVLVWSATIVQPSTAVLFAIAFAIHAVIAALIGWRAQRSVPLAPVLAIVLGGTLSLVTWTCFILAYGWTKFAGALFLSSHVLGAGDTSEGIVYGVTDIVFAPLSSKIDQATGLGWLACVFVLVALVAFVIRWRARLTPGNAARTVVVAWLVFGLTGIEGNGLPVKLFPHRFWVLLAIPTAYLAAEGIVVIASLMRREAHRHAAAAVLTGGVVLTSFGPRLAVQHGIWPPGVGWSSNEELNTYIQLKDLLPAQSRVFALCSGDERLIGMNMDSRPWEKDVQRLEADLPALTGDRIASFMRAHEYEYVVLDGMCASRLGVASAEALVRSMSASSRFVPILQAPGIVVARIVP